MHHNEELTIYHSQQNCKGTQQSMYNMQCCIQHLMPLPLLVLVHAYQWDLGYAKGVLAHAKA